MFNLAHQIFRGLGRDQQGITGLETAIVLIAFVVVSSVFAFAALSTGLFTTDKAKQTIHAGLAETQGTMELKGSVTATSAVTGSSGTVSYLAFWVANAAGGENTDLTPGKTIIKYTDANQTQIFDDTPTSTFTVTGIGLADTDTFLERGETYEIKLVGLESGSGGSPLGTNLSTSTTFSLEVIPPTGAILFIERTTPASFNVTESLD
jgi:flagellin FlaB